jgi:ABC-type nitrate/sulfonate/bicarbonate transport systems, periplasmic components
MKKFRLATISAAVCLASLVSAHAADTPVRINQAFQSLLYLPLYVAQEQGFFKQQGVDVKISTGGGGAQSWAAVIGGSADFSIQDPVFVPKTRENGGKGWWWPGYRTRQPSSSSAKKRLLCRTICHCSRANVW